jgi:hypothetical protein
MQTAIYTAAGLTLLLGLGLAGVMTSIALQRRMNRIDPNNPP